MERRALRSESSPKSPKRKRSPKAKPSRAVGEGLHLPCHLGIRLESQEEASKVSILEAGQKHLWIFDKGVHPAVMLFLTAVGKIIAMPASEILASWREVKLGYPPSARSAIDYQRTDKPVSDPAEVAGSSNQFHLIIQVSFFFRECICLGVKEPEITSAKALIYRYLNTDAADDLASGIFPFNTATLKSAKVSMAGEPGDVNGLALLNRVSI
ncbi:MAG: hypothetical protein ACUVV0_15910 [Anaerolineae bacterium]